MAMGRGLRYEQLQQSQAKKPGMNNKVLIIEDNSEIADLISLHLRDIQSSADVAADGQQGLKLFSDRKYDLVILDVMLPGIDGLDVCKRLRVMDPGVAVIMLTSKGTEPDLVLGLEAGADDYMVKPFSIPELQARVKAQFRRQSSSQKKIRSATTVIQAGELQIDVDKRQTFRKGVKIELTLKEFELLLHFATNPGRVYSRADLLNQLWEHSYEGYEHTVNSHISRLRNKIESNPAKPEYILTAWGIGYQFNDRF